MAENFSRSKTIHLGNLEQRVILFLGDLLASIIALGLSIYVWREYSWQALLATGITEKRAERIFSIEIQFWVYFLPLIWLLLLIEIYEPIIAANRKKTQRGILVAAVIGSLGYALLFTIVRNPTSSLPRVVIGAFLIFAALLTWLWRSFYSAIHITRVGAPCADRRCG